MNKKKLTRREFLAAMGAAGLGAKFANWAPGSTPYSVLPRVRPQEERPLTVTYYQWIINLHPKCADVTDDFSESVYPADLKIAPVEGFSIDRFVAEARDEFSTWDVYVGMTPFVEMASLVKAGVIEPWDEYIPQDVLDDLIPSIREECSYEGKLYCWPLLLDIVVGAYNSAITEEAGITESPEVWAQWLEFSQQVIDSEAALYGCTFDAHGWRSLAPITHSLSTDVYTEDGRFDFTSDAAVEALKLIKQMMELSSPDVLLPGTTDAGVNLTPDENAFGAQQVAYYVKYQNAPLRFAQNWPDPGALRLIPLPKFEGGEGATVFWDTGACLFKYGQNKEQAVEYMKALTYDQRIWKDSIGGSEAGKPGHLPPYGSVFDEWDADTPDWLEAEEWVPLVRGQLEVARAIVNHPFGLTQFVIGQPYWEKYLKGEVEDPKEALQEAWDAVTAEMEKAEE